MATSLRCRVSAILYNGMPLPPPSKLPIPMGDLEPHLIHGSLGSPESSTQTASWSVQAFMQGSLVWQTDRQTDQQTTLLGRIYVRNTAMRPNMRVVQQVPGLVLYFTQQQTHKSCKNVISQHTFSAVQYNLPSAQQVAWSLQHRNLYQYCVEISGHAASLHHHSQTWFHQAIFSEVQTSGI